MEHLTTFDAGFYLPAFFMFQFCVGSFLISLSMVASDKSWDEIHQLMDSVTPHVVGFWIVILALSICISAQGTATFVFYFTVMFHTIKVLRRIPTVARF